MVTLPIYPARPFRNVFAKCPTCNDMARQPRLIIPRIPHHITQRGNRRQNVFFSREDRVLFLELMAEYFDKFSIQTLAYCLMTNHLHIVAVPPELDSFHLGFKSIFRRYSFRKNRERGWTGHYWEERFFSSPLDENHLVTAVRYVECNPVRANMVPRAEDYPWSSAGAHCGLRTDAVLSHDSPWNHSLPSPECWSAFLASYSEEELANARKSFRRGLPFGREEFVQNLEKQTGRYLRPRTVGRPARPVEC